MKHVLVRVAKNILPAKALHSIEKGYRRTRTKLLSVRYGNPSKYLRVIVVTGTNGKTTTACYINEILKEARFKTALLTDLFTEIDRDVSVNKLDKSLDIAVRIQQFFRHAKKAAVDYAVIEIKNSALEKHKMEGVPIEAVVMTNLTDDHLPEGQSMEEYAEIKARLFGLNPRFIVLNRDDQWYDYFNKFTASDQKMSYGRHDDAEARITRVKLYRKGTEADVVLDHQTHLELATNLPGKFNVMNMTAATTLAYLLGIRLRDIQEGVANLESLPARFERAVEGLGFDVVVDSANTPNALRELLDSTRELSKGRVLMVFGANGVNDPEKWRIMGRAVANAVDRIFLTDESTNNQSKLSHQALREGIRQRHGDGITTEIANRYEAIERALGAAQKGDTVLIAGMDQTKLRTVNGQHLPWDDKVVVQEILRRKSRSV